jgi:hypothetical protein
MVRSTRTNPASLILLGAFWASACSEPGGFEEPIVPTWSLTEQLRIGSLDDKGYALTQIRPLGLAVGPGGQTFVAQPQAGEIRVFDSDGTFVQTIGRSGRGPGEFNDLYAIGTLGDTLYAINRSPGRLSLFTVAGQHLRTTNLVFPPPTPFHMPTPPFRLFPDGTGVLSPFALSEAYARGQLQARDHVRVDREGRLINTIHSHTEATGLAIAHSAGGVLSMRHPMPEFPVLAFSHDGSRVAIVERKVSGSDRPEFRITELTLEGDTLHSTGIPYRPVPIPAEVVDSIYASVTAIATRFLGTEGERAVRGLLQLPGHYPLANEVLYADDSSLWIRREGGRSPARPAHHWEIYRDGARVARVDAPRGLAIHVIRGNALWGVEVDEFDVPYVVRYHVNAGAS